MTINANTIKIALTALFIFLGACGQDEGKNAADAETGATSDSLKVVETKKKLPECSEGNESRLIYVRADKQLYVCEAGEWQVAEIEGSEPAAKVEQARALSSNEWFDAITGKTWLIAGQSTGSGVAKFCAKPYRQATSEEVVAAMQNGMQHKMTALGITLLEIWTGDTGANNTRNFVMYTQQDNWHAQPGLLTYTKTVVCIQP